MKRRDFIQTTVLSAVAISASGFIKFDGSDILGPFYRAGAPLRSDLTYDGLVGNRILLKGKVFKSDCITAIKDTLIEIWHCNTEGEYDNDTKEFRQRASLNTNDKELMQ